MPSNLTGNLNRKNSEILRSKQQKSQSLITDLRICSPTRKA